MSVNDTKSERSPVTVVVALAGLVIISAGMRAGASVLVPVLIAAFLAILLTPSVQALLKRSWPKGLAVVTTILGTIIVALLLTALVGDSLVRFSRQVPEYATGVQGMKDDIFAWLSQRGIGRDLEGGVLDSAIDTSGVLALAGDVLGIRDNTLFIFTADNGPEMIPEGSSTPSVDYFIPGTAGPWRGSLFTGFEGSLRVPFAARWPCKIPAGSVSDEIVHEMDLYPTFARIAGGTVPEDRVIDGVDQTDFLLGKQEKSNREGLIVYMGNDVWGVKWRNWKVNLKEQQNILSETLDYGMPRIYNLHKDPGETQNVLFPETWVPKAALGQLGAHVVSLRTHPPIKAGTKDPYKPGGQ